jgi:tight adherence protein C
MMLVLALLLVGGATYFLLQGVTASRRDIAISLRRAKSYGGSTLREAELNRGVQDRVVGPAAQRLAEIALRATPKASIEDVSRRLQTAGLSGTNPTSYLAGKAIAGGVSLLLGVLLGVIGGQVQTALLVTVAGVGGSFIVPDYVLSMKTRRRCDDMVAQMPDVLDLLTVSVEAGLGFDAAVQKVCEKLTGPLTDELRVVLHEMRIGESRAKALRNMGTRIDSPEVASFARSIVQADQLGISLGRILRVQAQDIRNRRQMQAEEKAMKAPVKMLFPTALFIFPAMFIVILGPAMINLMKVFSGG